MSDQDGRSVGDYISLHKLANEVEKGGWWEHKHLAEQLRRYPDVLTVARSKFLEASKTPEKERTQTKYTYEQLLKKLTDRGKTLLGIALKFKRREKL